jgi:hypothetical protein
MRGEQKGIGKTVQTRRGEERREEKRRGEKVRGVR